MVVVSNSSPLIALSRIGKLEILRKLYHKIVIPKAVEKEIVSDPLKEFNLGKLPWIEVKSLRHPLCVEILSADLGLGESEALSLGLELKADLILLDEVAARAIAESIGLRFTGTLGMLLKAKEKKFIQSVKELIEQLILCEFRVSDQLYKDILALAKEKHIPSPK